MLFDDKKEIKSKELWEWYPDLFEAEKAKYEEEKKTNDMELYKVKMKDFMYRHNTLRKGGE